MTVLRLFPSKELYVDRDILQHELYLSKRARLPLGNHVY